MGNSRVTPRRSEEYLKEEKKKSRMDASEEASLYDDDERTLFSSTLLKIPASLDAARMTPTEVKVTRFRK